MSQAATALYWRQLRERTPELPADLTAAMPDPHHRSEHFRWASRCLTWWTGQGVTAADAGVLWGALIAARLAVTDPYWAAHGMSAHVHTWGWRRGQGMTARPHSPSRGRPRPPLP